MSGLFASSTDQSCTNARNLNLNIQNTPGTHRSQARVLITRCSKTRHSLRKGIRLARIHSHLDETELRRMAFMKRTCREILEASGVGEILDEYGSYDTSSYTHVFGSCRMGSDPRRSMVDHNCRSHCWRNLFVVDASVFPSSGGCESPSLTIEALAIRSADHIWGLMQLCEI